MSLLNKLFDRLKKAAARKLWTWRLWIVLNLAWGVPSLLLASAYDSTRLFYARFVDSVRFIVTNTKWNTLPAC